MKRLNLNELRDILPGKIFAKGITIDNPSGINMSNSNEKLKWTAVKGFEIDSWCIYINSDGYTYNEISKIGDKVYGEHNITRLVPCSKEVLKGYRG